MKLIFKIIIGLTFLITTKCYAIKDSTAIGSYANFKTEFVSLDFSQMSFQKNSNGRWVLAPLGFITAITGGVVGAAGIFVGAYWGFNAPDFNAKLAAAGLISGGIIIGGGLLFLGAKMISESSNSGGSKKKKLTKRQKEIQNIKVFEGY